MKFHLKVAISVIPLVTGYILWPYLERTPSRIALCATGLALALAWYSILDLQAQRHESFLPHTVDRLLRATITAITLVFVFNFAWPTPTTNPEPVDDIVVETRILRFVEEIEGLIAPSEWTEDDLSRVAADHFAKMTGSGSIKFHLADGRNFELLARDTIKARPIQ